VDQQPYLQGYYSVVQLVLALRGRFTPMDMNTGAGLVDQKEVLQVAELVRKNVR
jgi:ABC-type sugar transport system substrate-binding protein